MGLLQDAAQRAATIIRQVLGGGPAPAEENVTPFPTRPGNGNGSVAASRPAVARPSADSIDALARKLVHDNRALFGELFYDAGAGTVRRAARGAAIERAFAAGRGANLSPQSFRMAVVGCRIGSCPDDGIALTAPGLRILSEEFGQRSTAVH